MLILGWKQNVHQNTSKGKLITFHFQKSLIFYSYYYILKSTQVFIGSAIATQSRVVKEEIPVFQVVMFAHPCSPNSYHICTGSAVTLWIPGVAVVCSQPAALSMRLPRGFLPLKISGSDTLRVTRCVLGFPWCPGPWYRAISFAVSVADGSASYFKMYFLFFFFLIFWFNNRLCA